MGQKASLNVKDKDKKELRKQMIENARGKVMNYAQAMRGDDSDSQEEDGDIEGYGEDPQMIAIDE